MAMKKATISFLVLLFVPFFIFGQGATKIKGTVSDADGNPLPGANVLIKSLNIGAATDINGEFSFEVPESQSTGQVVVLTARFVGYKESSVNITLAGGKTIEQNFKLAKDVFESEQVVVTGIASKTSKGVAEVSVSRLDAVGYTEVNSY